MKTKRPYYGWYIVAIAVGANFMAVGSGFYALNAFLEPLCELRQWSRTDINLALTFGTFFGFLGQFLYGTLVIRTGPRVLMTFGALCAGTAFAVLFRMDSLPAFYALYVLLYLSNGAYGGIVANTAVSNWFVQKRGTALGIATAGMSLAGAVLPVLAMILIVKIGLVNAAMAIGLAIAFLGPVAWLVIRDWPEQYGIMPVGVASPAAPLSVPAPGPNDEAISVESDTRSSTPAWSLGALVRTGDFWKIGMAYGLMMIGVVGVMSQLKPRFSDLGFSPAAAMGMMAVTALIGAGGKYTWGALCDRFDASRVASIMTAAIAVGLVCGIFYEHLTAVALFIVIFGFAMGGVLSTFPVLVADRFGREAFPRVFRFLYLFLILQMTGYLISGLSYDLTGSYDTAYLIFVGLNILAFMLLLSVRPAPKMA